MRAQLCYGLTLCQCRHFLDANLLIFGGILDNEDPLRAERRDNRRHNNWPNNWLNN
jgi:hypothetical protein